MPEPKVQIPLDKDGVSKWRGEIQRAEHVVDQVCHWWDANLKKYAPQPTDDPDQYGSEINTNRDFTLVERKKADLFYQRPDVSCKPSPLFAGQEALMATHAEIMNEKLGADVVNAKLLAHQALFDVLCPAGTGFTVMGYEQFATDVPTEGLMPPGAVLGLSVPQQVSVPVFERCFWEHVSPKRALKPAHFRSTDWDAAPWLGYKFELPLRAAKRLWELPDDFKGGKTSDKMYFDHGLHLQPGEDVVTGVRLWYKSALYRDDVIHPLHLTVLVLLDGLDDPVEHRDFPDQTLDDRGRLTPDSMIGFPMHPLTVRVLTDSQLVPSDCTISRPLVNELNKFREQMVRARDVFTLVGVYNTDTLPKDALDKAVRAPVGGMIGIPGDAYAGDGPFKPIERGNVPRENFSSNDYIDNDLARTHGIDAGGAGVQGDEAQTATAEQRQQANQNARLDFERGIVLDWYIKGVTKYSTLIQRYLSVEQAAEIVGPEKAAAWDQWRKVVPASLAFTALPNSALRSDAAQEARQAQEDYTFLVNDPQVNRIELLKVFCSRRNYDASKLIVEQPPEKQPEPAKPSFAFKGEDLNPLAPQFSIVMEVLRQGGIKISPQAVQEAQAGAMNSLLMGAAVGNDTGEGATAETKHGGKAPQAESLDKHHAELTGAMQGIGGAPTPMGAGGVQ